MPTSSTDVVTVTEFDGFHLASIIQMPVPGPRYSSFKICAWISTSFTRFTRFTRPNQKARTKIF